jgi:hypothetical protein
MILSHFFILRKRAMLIKYLKLDDCITVIGNISTAWLVGNPSVIALRWFVHVLREDAGHGEVFIYQRY